jgi:Tfp pilus assembly protein PilN
MKTLGIYFGPSLIQLAETEGTKLLNSVQIPLARLVNPSTEEKIPDELRIAAALKDELRKHALATANATLMLPGRDLIIRTFTMPILPANELFNAVRFEAKKYIPFKVEELLYDYQLFLDKASRKYLVLFVGAKKDGLDKYQSIAAQLGIKLDSIEYGGFSLLRLAQLAKVRERGVSAVVNVDIAEGDEVNFLVLENNFPLFSRDIILSGEAAPEGAGVVKPDLAQGIEKLKVELRISLDFYLRKFPSKNITSVTFIGPEEFRSDLEGFIKERGIVARFLDTRKIIDRPGGFSSSLLKAYSASINRVVKSDIRIDLLPSRVKARSQERSSLSLPGMFSPALLGRNLLIAGLIIALPLGFYSYRIQPLKVKIDSIRTQRPVIRGVNADASYDELVAVNKQYAARYEGIVKVLKDRPVVTGNLDALPRVIPDGVWLRDMRFRREDKGTSIVIEGSAYLGDPDAERAAVNAFLVNLKSNPQFAKLFKPEHISLSSVTQAKAGKVDIINFSIECRSK